MMSLWRILWFAAVCITGQATAGDSLLIPLAQARTYYLARHYTSAIELLEKTIAEPSACSNQRQCAEVYRWLGRAYGREAQQANWFKAPGLAKKARISFEKAVELDPENVPAWRDLFKYYSRAPAFLGGGEDKAKFAAGRLQSLDEALGRQAAEILQGGRTDFSDAE